MMKSNFVIAMAVVGFIAASACTRNGQGGSPPPIQQPPAASATPIPNSGSELDNGSGNSSQDSKDAPDNSNNGPIVVTNPNGGPVTAPTNNDQPEKIVYDPTGLTPAQVFESSRLQGQPVVGGESDLSNAQSQDPLYYSGSAQDSLREQVQNWVDANTEASHVRADQELARSLTSGRFDVNWTTRTATFDLSVKNGAGKSNVSRVTGHLSNRLTLTAKTGALKISLACMDLIGGCQTVYALIQDTSGGVARNAHMIVRQSPATLYTKAAGFGLARNPEFDSLLETLVRTDRHAGEPNALNSLTLRTSETINGQSNYVVEMGILSIANAQETLKIAGKLVKPANEFSMNAFAHLLQSTSPAAKGVRDITLIKNDGRGNLTLAVTIRKSTAESSEDSMELTFSRLQKPVRPLMIK